MNSIIPIKISEDDIINLVHFVNVHREKVIDNQEEIDKYRNKKIEWMKYPPEYIIERYSGPFDPFIAVNEEMAEKRYKAYLDRCATKTLGLEPQPEYKMVYKITLINGQEYEITHDIYKKIIMRIGDLVS